MFKGWVGSHTIAARVSACVAVVWTQPTSIIIGVGAQSTLGGTTFLAEKYV